LVCAALVAEAAVVAGIPEEGEGERRTEHSGDED
jgi:hypothetical protein